MCRGLSYTSGGGGGDRHTPFYCKLHIYNQQFYFSNWKKNLSPRKGLKDYILFLCEGTCFIHVCVFHSFEQNRCSQYFFLSERISLCDIWESRNPETQSALSRVGQLVCSREKIQIQLLCLQVRHFLWHCTDTQEVDSLNTETFTQVGN